MKDYDNFFLPSGDLKKGKEFYHDVLGLPVKFDFSDMGMVAFKVGDNEPAIILKDIHKFSRRETDDLVRCGQRAGRVQAAKRQRLKILIRTIRDSHGYGG